MVAAAARILFILAAAGGLLACACSRSRKEANHQDFGTVTVGGRIDMLFYVELGADSGVIGFSVAGATGQRTYFPLYASTYRGLPEGTLTVLTSPEEDAVWITSSWPGYELLGYHRIGTDICLTRYGAIHGLSTPMPDVLGGDTTPIPTLDRNTAKKLATLTIPNVGSRR